MLKGIQSVEDAKKAVELGVDGIYVSNHAGRQVDGACASLDALERIVNGTFSPLNILVSNCNSFSRSRWRQDVYHVRLWNQRG